LVGWRGRSSLRKCGKKQEEQEGVTMVKMDGRSEQKRGE
jgi:hypothetical protein